MSEQLVVVQASSTSWSGSADLCMNLVDGFPVVHWTVRKLLDEIPGQPRVVIAAPESDTGGALARVAAGFAERRVSCYFGHDASPLARLIDVARELEDDAPLLRVDGLHMFVDTLPSQQMLSMARRDQLDCVELPDDFPAQFTSDVYRVGALRRADAMLPPGQAGDVFLVHPKFFMFQRPDAFRCEYLPNPPRYDDDTLRGCRAVAQAIYHTPREDVNGRRLWPGDQLGFHYEIARPHLRRDMKVIDLACGTGHGTRMISDAVREAHGGDLDPEIVRRASELTPAPNVSFHVADALATGFQDGEFDAVLSMETIEHVDGGRFVDELHRILAPAGLLILSTPQNCQGHVPVTAFHEREYSFEELVELVGQRFEIRETIGLKQGRIIVPGDPRGQNTVLVAAKPPLARDRS